jgi:hypothetical protein
VTAKPSKHAAKKARSNVVMRKVTGNSALDLMIGEGILARVAQMLMRLGAGRRALLTAIDATTQNGRDPRKEFTGLARKVFFDYPAILHEWHTNPRFTDVAGMPAKLPLRGRRRSFSALVQHTQAGADPEEALSVLVRLRAVSKIGKTSVVARSRVLNTVASHDLTAARLLSVVHAMLTTVEKNLEVTARQPGTKGFYERAATNHRVDARHVPEFQSFLQEQGDDFLQVVDDWLAAHSVTVKSTKRRVKTLRVGTGVYMFASD